MDDILQIAAINYKHGFQEINGFLDEQILKIIFYVICSCN